MTVRLFTLRFPDGGWIRGFACLGLSAILCSCASVSVKETNAAPDAKVVVPSMIYVHNFTIDQAEFRVDRGGEALAQFELETSERLSRMLVRRLRERIGRAKVVASSAPLPRQNAWLITGRFDRVYQGSRALRMVIGLGLGATKMETTVKVYDLRDPNPLRRPILTVKTTGGSNMTGGLLGSAYQFNPYLFALNVVGNLQSGIVFDTGRTAREITAALSEFLYQNGAITEREAVAPKRLGTWP